MRAYHLPCRCGSCSVFEVAHSVNKYTLNECPFGCGYPTRNCGNAAISLAQSANIIVAKSNNITHTLRAYHLHCLAARVPFLNKHIPCIRTQTPLIGNPNVHIVHELSIKGLCKERSDGRAIVTKSIASNAIRSIVRSGQIFVKLLDNLIKILDPVLLC